MNKKAAPAQSTVGTAGEEIGGHLGGLRWISRVTGRQAFCQAKPDSGPDHAIGLALIQPFRPLGNGGPGNADGTRQFRSGSENRDGVGFIHGVNVYHAKHLSASTLNMQSFSVLSNEYVIRTAQAGPEKVRPEEG